ncbi:TIGR04282 family arsenosugar biosynthesis glycosyltransferase [Pseudomonadota bacterium]
MQFPEARILIFAKAPEPGYVKTRLISALGAEGAAGLYMSLLKQTVGSVTAASLAPIQLWCSPDCDHIVFQQLARQYNLSLYQQSGSDLGERMYSAANLALAESEMVLLIGADCPVLNSMHLSQALRWLNEGNDAVVGPAEDGGYVLLGLRKNDARLFENMPWGGDRVLKLTRKLLTELGWHWQELEPLWDLDRPEDIERWHSLQNQ